MAWDDEMQSLAGACADAFGVSATYRRVTPGAYTGSTGVRAETTTDTAVTITRGASRVEEGMKRKIEIVQWSIEATQLAAAPAVGDRIVVGAAVHQITEVAASCNLRAFDLTTARTVA